MRFWPFKKKPAHKWEVVKTYEPFQIEIAPEGYEPDPLVYPELKDRPVYPKRAVADLNPNGYEDPLDSVSGLLSYMKVVKGSKALIAFFVEEQEYLKGEPHQYCPRCHEIKPQTLWSPSKRGKNGMYDKKCTNEHRVERNAEKKVGV